MQRILGWMITEAALVSVSDSSVGDGASIGAGMS